MIKKNTLNKFIKIPLSIDFNQMTAGSVFPTYQASDFTILPIAERFRTEPLKGNYKAIEIQARLVNSTATPMTFDFVVGGTTISASNISYSPILITYAIPVINQISTTFSKLQIGVSSNSINKALEAYVIYELI